MYGEMGSVSDAQGAGFFPVIVVSVLVASAVCPKNQGHCCFKRSRKSLRAFVQRVPQQVLQMQL